MTRSGQGCLNALKTHDEVGRACEELDVGEGCADELLDSEVLLGVKELLLVVLLLLLEVVLLLEGVLLLLLLLVVEDDCGGRE